MNAADPTKPLFIEHMTITNGQIQQMKATNAVVSYKLARLELLAVTNRGKVYRVPTKHLGRAIDSLQPIKLAHSAIAFYGSFLDKAEAHFIK